MCPGVCGLYVDGRLCRTARPPQSADIVWSGHMWHIALCTMPTCARRPPPPPLYGGGAAVSPGVILLVPGAGVNFTIDPAAQSLLSITGQQVSARRLHGNLSCWSPQLPCSCPLQVNFAAMSLANITLTTLNVLNVSSGTYNFTNSNVAGA